MLSNIILGGNTSALGNSISFICHKYRLSRYNLPDKIPYNNSQANIDDIVISGAISDFINPARVIVLWQVRLMLLSTSCACPSDWLQYSVVEI